jgi:hypothetical protein
MRSPEEIGAMRDRFEDNIIEHGWDSSIDAASRALEWVLGDTPWDGEVLFRRWMGRPDADRRRDWIARGGDPDGWPIEPERPTDTEEPTA